MSKTLQILTDPNPLLVRVCRPDFIIPQWLIPEMFRLMRKNDGLGLAAPQVGIDARLFVTIWEEIFVNPVLTNHSDICLPIQESCLSFPGRQGVMKRWDWIEINGHQYAGERAIIIQHEIDHLNGITILNGYEPNARLNHPL